MEVVATAGAIRHTKLQSNRHHQQTNNQGFTGRMPFLEPNEQLINNRPLGLLMYWLVMEPFVSVQFTELFHHVHCSNTSTYTTQGNYSRTRCVDARRRRRRRRRIYLSQGYHEVGWGWVHESTRGWDGVGDEQCGNGWGWGSLGNPVQAPKSMTATMRRPCGV